MFHAETLLVSSGGTSPQEGTSPPTLSAAWSDSGPALYWHDDITSKYKDCGQCGDNSVIMSSGINREGRSLGQPRDKD